MEKQFFKKLSCGLVVASLALIAGVVIGSANNASNELFTKASDELAVTYSRSTGTFKNNGNNIYTTSASSSRGNISYLSCQSYAGNLGSDYIASFPGKYVSEYGSTTLTFSSGDTGSAASSHYKFQFLKSISASISSTTAITWHLEKSYDGSNWESAGDMTFSSKSASSTSIRGAKFLRITEPTRAYSLTSYGVNSITLEYDCSELDPVKSLSSIQVVSPKTEYNVDDSFVEPSVTAYYDGGESSASVSGATFSGYDMSTAGNQTVTASYTENGVTKTTSYSIKVGSAPVVSGKYTNASNFTIDFDSQTYNYGVYKINFTFVYNGSSITFTLNKSKPNDDISNFGSSRLFKNHTTDTTNTTTSFTVDVSLIIKVFNVFGSQLSSTFNKVS